MTTREQKNRAKIIAKIYRKPKIDNEKLTDEELIEKSKAITPLIIVESMFNYQKFFYKFEDEAQRMMLPEDTDYLIREFVEKWYRRCEWKFVMWTAGMRYNGIKSLKELDLQETVYAVMQSSLATVKTNLVSIKSDYLTRKNTVKSNVVLDNNFM